MLKIAITPKIMKNICMNAHPLGCEKSVQAQITYVKQQGILEGGPKNVLVIGGSAGYGLATRIATAYGYKSKTLNVAFEMPANEGKKRPASVGWYNTHSFEAQAKKDGLWVKSIFGDAFSGEIKQQTIQTIKENLGMVDLVIYSLASGKRIDPNTGETYSSVLKPLGNPFSGRTIDIVSSKLSDITVEPANELELQHTIKVMGGEDWKLWIEALLEAGVLSENFTTLAYSYIGPELTYPLYRSGTIGKAKEDLEHSAHEIDLSLQKRGVGRAYVSVNKALVTRASMVIPVVPLYLAALYKIMKEENLHEACIQQMYRLCKDKLYNGRGVITDNEHRIRLDDWEMKKDIQAQVMHIWHTINEENINTITDLQGLREEFYQLHGFEWSDIDYFQPVEL